MGKIQENVLNVVIYLVPCLIEAFFKFLVRHCTELQSAELGSLQTFDGSAKCKKVPQQKGVLLKIQVSLLYLSWRIVARDQARVLLQSTYAGRTLRQTFSECHTHSSCQSPDNYDCLSSTQHTHCSSSVSIIKTHRVLQKLNTLNNILKSYKEIRVKYILAKKQTSLGGRRKSRNSRLFKGSILKIWRERKMAESV